MIEKNTQTPLWEGINIFTTIRNNCKEKIINTIIDSMIEMNVDIITSNVE